MPEADPETLAILGKLGEESSELSAKLFRAVIQGIDGKDPETGEGNLDAIVDEIADVMAMARIAIRRLNIDAAYVERRIAAKTAFKEPWFEFLAAQAEGEGDGSLYR